MKRENDIRPYEELSESYPILDMDVKKKILKRVDAKNAMVWARTDKEIRAILSDDTIWKKWFKRDLSIIPSVIPKWFPQEGESPIWKRYYLWCRLCIGSIQWNLIKYWMEPTRRRDWDHSIEYRGFNMLTNGTLFKNKFIDETGLDYTFDNIFNVNERLSFSEPYDFKRFITGRYKGANVNTPNIDNITDSLARLANMIRKKYRPDQLIVWRNGVTTTIFETSPHIFHANSEKLLVACSVCESAESQHRCSSCDKPYCSVECAQRDWDNYNCIKQ